MKRNFTWQNEADILQVMRGHLAAIPAAARAAQGFSGLPHVAHADVLPSVLTPAVAPARGGLRHSSQAIAPVRGTMRLGTQPGTAEGCDADDTDDSDGSEGDYHLGGCATVWEAYVEAALASGDEESWTTALGGAGNAPVMLRSGGPARTGGAVVRLEKSFLRAVRVFPASSRSTNGSASERLFAVLVSPGFRTRWEAMWENGV